MKSMTRNFFLITIFAFLFVAARLTLALGKQELHRHDVATTTTSAIATSTSLSSLSGHRRAVRSPTTTIITSDFGSVLFPTSCDPSVADDFNTAMSMFYSFWFSESLSIFNSIVSRDHSCCMAYWGAAYTYSHPIWDYISESRLISAANYSHLATACALKYPLKVNSMEKAYIDSLAVYMNISDTSDPATHLLHYANTLKEKVMKPYSTSDDNVGIIYGLALLAVGFYSENEPANNFPYLRQAGIIEEEMAYRNQLSPGALHYVIHSYDQPGLASRALDASYKYLNASISVPHAIHMPSHIFCDLGLWPDSVSSNTLSMNTAYNIAGHTTGDWYHGAYFLQFSMLQLAMDCKAHSLMIEYQKMSIGAESSTFLNNKESILRVPIHYYIETRNWAAAAKFNLETFYPSSTPETWDSDIWTRIYADFMVTVAKSILDYPKSEIAAAWEAVQKHNYTLFSDPGWIKYQLPYWRLSFNVMVESARAWLEFRTVSYDAGISSMEELLALQKKSWQPEVAHAWDAHEQLGEMLLIRRKSGDIEYALAVYESALTLYPNRYHTLAGAANCASLLKDQIKASKYYGSLLTLTSILYPDVAVKGVILADCPISEATMRPEVVAAKIYFAAASSSFDDGSTSGNSVGISDGFSVSILTLIWSILLTLLVGLAVGWFGKAYYQQQRFDSSGYSNNLYIEGDSDSRLALLGDNAYMGKVYMVLLDNEKDGDDDIK